MKVAGSQKTFVICDDDTPVGMGLHHDCPELECYDLSQLFIDARHQGRGYGRAARKLYGQFGFVVTDRDGDEIIMELTL